MNHLFRAIAPAACGLLILAAGCAKSNEDQAAIKGVAPTDAPKSQAEYGAAMRGAQGGTQGYPGSN